MNQIEGCIDLCDLRVERCIVDIESLAVSLGFRDHCRRYIHSRDTLESPRQRNHQPANPHTQKSRQLSSGMRRQNALL